MTHARLHEELDDELPTDTALLDEPEAITDFAEEESIGAEDDLGLDTSAPSSSRGAAHAKTSSGRKEVIPPDHIPPGMNLFEYLLHCQPSLHVKIAQIAVRKAGVPSQIAEEAVQEIFVMWGKMTPDVTKYKPRQIASYAHQAATHAALRTWRDLGSATRLPGSAFRKRSDGSTYVSPGVLAAPLDWNEMDRWYDADDSSGMPEALSALSVSIDEMADDLAAEEDVDDDEQNRATRLALLEKHKDEMPELQYQIMKMLIEGAKFPDVTKALNVKKTTLLRHITIACQIMKLI